MNLLIPPPIQAIAAGGAMWLVGRLFPDYSFQLPGASFVAIGLIALGAFIDFVCVRAFVREKTSYSPFRPEKSGKLITTGLYRYSRNPMYLGLFIILAGLFLYIGNVLGALFLYGFIHTVTRFQIIPEEEILEEKFGDEYRDYRKRVRRWL